MNIASVFPEYKEFNPLVPVHCLTPENGGCIHRFFDTCPQSPSGRYIAVFKLPFEDRQVRPGDVGQIVVVDLETGVEKVVDETRGWEYQMGANLNWGRNADILIYNDVDTSSWAPHCVVLNWRTGERRTFGRGVYHVSPDGRYALCTNPAAMCRTQWGYGVIVPESHTPRHVGLSSEDGLWITDLETGECRLLISIKEAVERTVPKSEISEYDNFENYFFHSKWSPQGDRLILLCGALQIPAPASLI